MSNHEIVSSQLIKFDDVVLQGINTRKFVVLNPGIIIHNTCKNSQHLIMNRNEHLLKYNMLIVRFVFHV